MIYNYSRELIDLLEVEYNTSMIHLQLKLPYLDSPIIFLLVAQLDSIVI